MRSQKFDVRRSNKTCIIPGADTAAGGRAEHGADGLGCAVVADLGQCAVVEGFAHIDRESGERE